MLDLSCAPRCSPWRDHTSAHPLMRSSWPQYAIESFVRNLSETHNSKLCSMSYNNRHCWSQSRENFMLALSLISSHGVNSHLQALATPQLEIGIPLWWCASIATATLGGFLEKSQQSPLLKKNNQGTHSGSASGRGGLSSSCLGIASQPASDTILTRFSEPNGWIWSFISFQRSKSSDGHRLSSWKCWRSKIMVCTWKV